MNIVQKVSFQPQVRNLVMALIYVTFAGYTLYQIIQTPLLEGKIAYGLLLLVILGLALWAEYLRHLYKKAILLLNKEGKPEDAKQAFAHLLKKDIFHGYRKTVLIFDTLYYADQMEPEACLNTLEKDYKFFHSNMDNLLVWNYTKFYAYHLLHNRTQTKAQYERLIKLKDVKIKGTKISPLYNWEFIEGVYLLSRKDYKKSIQAFQNVNTSNMNTRELMHYRYQFAQAYLGMNDLPHAKEMLAQLLVLPGDATMKQCAQTLYKQCEVLYNRG